MISQVSQFQISIDLTGYTRVWSSRYTFTLCASPLPRHCPSRWQSDGSMIGKGPALNGHSIVLAWCWVGCIVISGLRSESRQSITLVVAYTDLIREYHTCSVSHTGQWPVNAAGASIPHIHSSYAFLICIQPHSFHLMLSVVLAGHGVLNPMAPMIDQ